MIKAIPVMAALAIAAATPVLAQQQYPSDNNSTTTTSPPPSRSYDLDQQARTPEPNTDRPGTVETLRRNSMSSPNVQGETVPENPATGVPDPSGRNDPKRLESVPRP